MFSLASKTGSSPAGTTNDTYFQYVSMLLHGDGTNGALNNTFLDSSTNNATVTRLGNTTQGNFVPFNYNYSMYNVGTTSGYFTLPTTYSAQYAALATATYGSKTTVEFWVFTTGIQAITSFVTGICGNYYSAAVNGRWNIALVGTSTTSTQVVRFVYTTGTGSEASVSSTATLTQNTWNHVAVTIDTTTASSSTIVIYVNGVGLTFTGQNLSTHTTDPGQLMYVGWVNYSLGYQNLTGYLSNFRMSRGSSLIYTGNFSVPTQNFTPTTSTKILLFQNPYARDDSPYSMPVTPNNATVISQFNPYLNYVQSTSTSYSGSFDGTGDYITFPNTTALQMSTGDFTWECWIFINKISTAMGVMGLGTASTGLEISVTSGNNIRASFTATNLTGATTLVQNVWYHVALVRSGSATGNIKIYLNGALEATSVTAITTDFNQTNSQVVGDVRATGTPFNGLISNVRIAKAVAVYTGTFTVPASPLASTQSSGTNISAITGVQTSLLTCQSSQFSDTSTFAYVPTTFAQARPNPYNPFGYTTSTALQAYSTTVNGGSMYFDGTGDYLNLGGQSGLAFGTNSWTVEFWVYFTGSPGNTNLFDTRPAGTTSTANYVSISTNAGVLNYYTAAANPAITGTTVTAGQWCHVAVCRNVTSTRLFVNGTQRGSTISDAQTYIVGANRPILGADGNVPTANLLTGYLSNLRVVNGTAIYPNTFVPSATPLTAVTSTSLLLSGTNAAIYDNATRNVMETSTASISTSVVKYGTGSIAFVGTGYMKYPLVPFFGLGAGDFTVEFWMYVTSTPTTEYTIWESQTTGAFIVHKRGSSSGLSFAPYGGTERLIQADASIPLSTWQFIAISRVSGTTSAYVNSTRTLSVADTNNYVIAATANPYTMGARNGGTLFMPGYIDDFRITLGVGRYSGATITVPTAAFPNQ